MLKNSTLKKMILSGLISITAVAASVASAVEIKLYARINYDTHIGTITSTGDHLIRRNVLTSIKISKGYGVILWDHWNSHKGPYGKLTTLYKSTNIKNNEYNQYNNKTSAITVFKIDGDDTDDTDECKKDEWGNCIDPKDPNSIDWSDVSNPSNRVNGTTGEVISCESTEVTVIVKDGFLDTCVETGKVINIVAKDADGFSQWIVVGGSGVFENSNSLQTKLYVKSKNGTTLTVKPSW